MTTPPITPGPEQPYTVASVMGPPVKKSSSAGIIIGGSIAGVAVLIMFVAAGLFFRSSGEPGEPTEAGQRQPAASSSTCPGYVVDANSGAVVCKGAESVANTGPTYAAPRAADFKVTVKILEKQCFGSAGCNVTYRISPDYTGAPLDPSVTWLVTYEVYGVEDSPQVNTFEVTGDEASFDAEEFAQTKSSKAKLTVKVTEILRG